MTYTDDNNNADTNIEAILYERFYTGIESMTSAIPVQCSTNWANKPTGSWIYFFRPHFHYYLSSIHNCSSTAVHIYAFHIFTVM